MARNNAVEQDFSRWVAKVPRLRTACTQCHAAKIRCSGDKTGCQRCNSLGLHCEYLVSMVGRTPKRQRKSSEARSNGARSSTSEGQPTDPPNTRPSYASSRGSVTDVPLSATNPPREEFDISRTITVSNTNIQTDFTDDQLFDCLNDDNWVSGGPSCPPALGDGTTFGETSGFEIEGFSLPSALQDNTATSPFLSLQHPLSSTIPNFFPMSPRSPGQSGAAATAQSASEFAHVVALCKMIRLLENHVQSKSMAVDEVMRLSQACIRDITKISANKDYMQCRSCPALISTIMELIVTLYEDTTRNPELLSSAPAMQKAAAAPCLQFGVFELDPEEQTAIRNRIIRKEAQKCVQIIQVLKQVLENEVGAGAGETGSGSSPGSGSGHGARASTSALSQYQALGSWYNGMEKRMNELIAFLMPAS